MLLRLNPRRQADVPRPLILISVTFVIISFWAARSESLLFQSTCWLESFLSCPEASVFYDRVQQVLIIISNYLKGYPPTPEPLTPKTKRAAPAPRLGGATHKFLKHLT